MRCKKHPSDLSSSGGVCASCLRERLLALIAAQSHLAHAQLRAAVEDRLKPVSSASEPPPPPISFPRSVSPYVSRRKSDRAAWPHLDRRFYSTPQAGPTAHPAGSAKKKRFSLLSGLFRSRSEKAGPDDPAEASSSSWFSSLLSGRRKKQLRLHSMDDSAPDGRRHVTRVDRGMSPAGTTAEEDGGDRSPPSSSEASPQRWRRTPTPSAARRGRHGHSRNVSGLAFCLSPLVRASPSRQWKQSGGGALPPELEVRVPAKPHLSTAAAFCANRSRKLADFGRLNHNR